MTETFWKQKSAVVVKKSIEDSENEITRSNSVYNAEAVSEFILNGLLEVCSTTIVS